MLFKSVLKAFNSIGLYSLKDTRNSKPQDIIKEPLEEAMKLWLDEEEIKEFYANRDKPKKESKFQQTMNKENAENIQWINAVKDSFDSEIQRFFEETIIPYLKYIDYKELQLILKILTILQNNKECPSVVSNYSGDPNIINYANKLVAGYTSFEALKEFVSLLQHSLSVAKNTLVVLNESKIPSIKKNKMIGQCLICGLAHDLGKIQRFDEVIKLQDLPRKEAYKKMINSKSHQDISDSILRDLGIIEFRMDIKYIEKVAFAVYNHHNAQELNDTLLNILINADIKTRNEEKEYCYNKIIEKLENLKAQEYKNKENTKEQETISNQNNEAKLESNSKDILVDYENRDLEYSIKLNQNGSYIALLGVSNNKKPILSKLAVNIKLTLQDEIEKNLNSLVMYSYKKNILLLFNSDNMTRARMALQKLLTNIQTDFTNPNIGYLHLKNEKSEQESLDKALKALEYAKGKNIGVTNFLDIPNTNENANKKIINDASLDTESINTLTNLFESTAQEIKALEKKIDINKESKFDAEQFLNTINQKIIDKISIVDSDSNGNPIFYAIPYKLRNRILVNHSFLISTIKNITNCDELEARKRTNYFVSIYSETTNAPRLIYDIPTRKGCYIAIYNLIFKGNPFKFYCVPFDIKGLGIEKAKMNFYLKQESLNGLEIKISSEKEQ